MSSFAVGGTSVSFTASDEGFRETLEGPVRQVDVLLLLASAGDWTTLVALRSWNVIVKPIPGGSNAYIDVGGGAGQGTLTLDNATGSPFNAILTRLDRPTAFPSGQRQVRAVFQAW